MIEGRQNDLLNPVNAADQLLPVLGRIDEKYRLAGNDLLGRTVKGEYGRCRVQLCGTLHSTAQQGAVAFMYAVKKTEGNDSRFHTFTLRKNF